MMKRIGLLLAATTFLGACGSDDPAPTYITIQQPGGDGGPSESGDAGDTVTRTVTEPVSPLGTVSGQVLDIDLVPLGGATIELMIGSQTAPRSATTDDKGFFAFDQVPGGSQVLLSFTKAGYATLRATSTVPATAGNHPLENANASLGPVLLAKLDGSISFRVALPNTQPAVGAVGTLRVTPAGTVIVANSDFTSSMVSVITSTAVADAQGVLEFKNVPSPTTMTRFNGGQYQLAIAPMDQNADGVAETGGYTTTYTAAAVITAGNLPVVTLAAPQSSGAP